MKQNLRLPVKCHAIVPNICAFLRKLHQLILFFLKVGGATFEEKTLTLFPALQCVISSYLPIMCLYFTSLST